MVNNNNFFVSYETDSQIEGVLIKNKPLILNPDMQQILEQKGFGEWEKNKFVLKPFESALPFTYWQINYLQR